MINIQIEAWYDRAVHDFPWFADRCGGNNEKTMVSVFTLLCAGISGSINFKLDNLYYQRSDSVTRDMTYFRTDGIYTSW